MSRIPLDVIDAASAEQSHYSLVAPSQLEPGGIDPLGMGAVNLGLAVSALPGINNVTSRIRVYSFLAWAWWRARKCFLERGTGKVDAKELQALVDRWEVLFIWSNMLHETNDGLPGRLKLGGALPKSGIYVMAGEQWDKLRGRAPQRADQPPGCGHLRSVYESVAMDCAPRARRLRSDGAGHGRRPGVRGCCRAGYPV